MPLNKTKRWASKFRERQSIARSIRGMRSAVFDLERVYRQIYAKPPIDEVVRKIAKEVDEQSEPGLGQCGYTNPSTT